MNITEAFIAGCVGGYVVVYPIARWAFLRSERIRMQREWTREAESFRRSLEWQERIVRLHAEFMRCRRWR